MKLTELCQVIQDVSNITVTLLTSEKDFRNFCKTWQFHDKQDYLKTGKERYDFGGGSWTGWSDRGFDMV